MNYKYLIIITTLIILVNCNHLLATDLPISQIPYISSSIASPTEYKEIVKISDCFKVYTSFFKDNYSIDDNLVSKHGENMNEGLLYLQQAFSEELAFHILDYFTYWNEDIDKQVIINCEGIPVFTRSDINKSSFYIEEDKITLKVNYYDCYELGDHYIYYITAHAVNGKYIINDLQWRNNNYYTKLYN